MSTSDELMIIWYSAYNAATGKYVSVQPDRFEVVDEHGCVFQVDGYGGTQSTPTFSVASARVRVFPRRQRQFIFRAKFVNYPPVDFKISNPVPPADAAWTPEPLPTTRHTNNDLTLTVTKVRPNETFTYLVVDYDIHVDGVYRNSWYSVARMLHDAAGNRRSDWLCPFERAWKLQMDLYKTAAAPFPESAIYSVPGIVVPEPGNFQMFTNEILAGSLRIRMIALCGAGDFVFSNDVCVSAAPWKDGHGETSGMSSSGRNVEHKFTSRQPSLLAKIEGWHTSDELLIRAGNREQISKSFHFRNRMDNMCRYVMDHAAPGEALQLELIPQQPLRFEFLVQPPGPAVTVPPEGSH